MVLVRQSRLLEARRIVQRLGGHSIDADLFVIQIEETIEYDERNAASSFYFDCFQGTKVRRRMIVFANNPRACFHAWVQEFSLPARRVSPRIRASILVWGSAGFGIIGNLVSLFTVNRFGRRGLSVWGQVACVIINLLMGFSSLAKTQSGNWSMAVFMSRKPLYPHSPFCVKAPSSPYSRLYSLPPIPSPSSPSDSLPSPAFTLARLPPLSTPSSPSPPTLSSPR